MRISKSLLVLVGLSGLVGCTVESPIDDESVGKTEDAIIVLNAMTLNAITLNAITLNALINPSNAMTANAMTANALTANALSAIQDPTVQGDLTREFLQYLVGCSFTPTQSFDFTWTDANAVPHAEHYIGEIGLAPQWRTGPLGKDGEHMVSACLAARVNYYGVHVTISIRSGEKPLRLHPHDDELDDFSKVEGAFWGNLWAPQPYINACFNSANVNNSRARSRDCAAGHLNSDGTIGECGLIDIVGTCASACKKFSKSRGYYEDCREQPGVNNKRTDLVITTALP